MVVVSLLWFGLVTANEVFSECYLLEHDAVVPRCSIMLFSLFTDAIPGLGGIS